MLALFTVLSLVLGPACVLVGVWEAFAPEKRPMPASQITSRTACKSLLRTAYRAIQRGFTAGSLARTPDGMPCFVNDSTAASWSLYGALQLGELHVAKAHGAGVAWDAFSTACDLVQAGIAGEYRRNLLRYNDAPGRTQTEVLALLERAGREV